jgi:hypothetical protein
MSSLNISGRRIVSMDEVDEMINAVDDGDGRLDFQEFIKLLTKWRRKPELKINAIHSFPSILQLHYWLKYFFWPNKHLKEWKELIKFQLNDLQKFWQ